MRGTEPEKNLPDRIADELIARIFTGELEPGDLLPPERTLAEELGVDRTSLRMALRQLTRMKLVRAVRGSGITVLDYRRNAGVDFLSAVLEIPGIELGGALLIEFLDTWAAAMPHITVSAFARATPRDLAALDRFFAAQLDVLDAGGSLEEVAELESQMQDAIFALAGTTVLGLVANSTRALRKRFNRLSLDFVDARAQVIAQRAQLRAVLEHRPVPEKQASAHRAYMARQMSAMRSYLGSLPPNPHRSRQKSH